MQTALDNLHLSKEGKMKKSIADHLDQQFGWESIYTH